MTRALAALLAALALGACGVYGPPVRSQQGREAVAERPRSEAGPEGAQRAEGERSRTPEPSEAQQQAEEEMEP